MFEKFPSLTRFSHGWTITEKLDGTNAAVVVVHKDAVGLTDGGSGLGMGDDEIAIPAVLRRVDGFVVMAQSRNRMLSLEQDNHGFARWVHDNAEALVAALGEGRHFGEWVGKGVNKRHYNLEQKVFALFNTHRWAGLNDLDGRLRCVPVLAEGYMGEPGAYFDQIMGELKEDGSGFAPGFMDPEGIVMRHGPSGTLFKKTFDYDEKGKWAENLAARNGQ